MACTFTLKIITFFVVLFIYFLFVSGKSEKKNKEDPEADKWKKKDIRDYTEADIERLYDQWEVKFLIKGQEALCNMYSEDILR